MLWWPGFPYNILIAGWVAVVKCVFYQCFIPVINIQSYFLSHHDFLQNTKSARIIDEEILKSDSEY